MIGRSMRVVLQNAEALKSLSDSVLDLTNSILDVMRVAKDLQDRVARLEARQFQEPTR